MCQPSKTHKRSAKTKDTKPVKGRGSPKGIDAPFQRIVVNTRTPELDTKTTCSRSTKRVVFREPDKRNVLIAAGTLKRKRTLIYKSVLNLFKRGLAQRQMVLKLNTIGEDTNRALVVRSSETGTSSQQHVERHVCPQGVETRVVPTTTKDRMTCHRQGLQEI